MHWSEARMADAEGWFHSSLAIDAAFGIQSHEDCGFMSLLLASAGWALRNEPSNSFVAIRIYDE